MCRRLVCRLYERFGVVCILLFAYRLHIYKVYMHIKIARYAENVTFLNIAEEELEYCGDIE